jgi:ABC-type transporter Mla MlaB component
MFRITSRIDGDEILLKVEGCLMREWVHELDACWVTAATDPEGRRVRVDLTDVCHVDAAGHALMTAMYRAGVRFLTKGCVMPEIVREIATSIEGCGRRAGGQWAEGGGRAQDGGQK